MEEALQEQLYEEMIKGSPMDPPVFSKIEHTRRAARWLFEAQLGLGIKNLLAKNRERFRRPLEDYAAWTEMSLDAVGIVGISENFKDFCILIVMLVILLEDDFERNGTISEKDVASSFEKDGEINDGLTAAMRSEILRVIDGADIKHHELKRIIVEEFRNIGRAIIGTKKVSEAIGSNREITGFDLDEYLTMADSNMSMKMMVLVNALLSEKGPFEGENLRQIIIVAEHIERLGRLANDMSTVLREAKERDYANSVILDALVKGEIDIEGLDRMKGESDQVSYEGYLELFSLKKIREGNSQIKVLGQSVARMMRAWECTLQMLDSAIDACEMLREHKSKIIESQKDFLRRYIAFNAFLLSPER